MVGVGAAFESFSSSSDSISKIVLGKIDHPGASSSSDTDYDYGTVSAAMDSSSSFVLRPSSNSSLLLSIALAFFLKLLFLGALSMSSSDSVSELLLVK